MKMRSKNSPTKHSGPYVISKTITCVKLGITDSYFGTESQKSIYNQKE